MKFHVNEDCIGCGLCEATCPEVFKLTDGGTAKASSGEVDAAAQSSAMEAKDNCPVSAIESD